MKQECKVDEATRRLLTELAERYETPEFIVGDPSWWMHQVEGDRNREATAFVAQALSYGSRQQFMPRIGHLLDLAGGDMDGWLRNGLYRSHFAPDDKACFYRLYNRATMYTFFEAYSLLLNRHGSMGEFLNERVRSSEFGVRRYPGAAASTPNSELRTPNSSLAALELICGWFTEHGASAVVPKDTTSACKRVCMFLRWMVRDGSPVDLGLWTFIDKRTLVMPLDTHVVSEAMTLGLLNSRSASMSAARRLTAAMAEVFPDDPLRGDFALFGYGVSKG